MKHKDKEKPIEPADVRPRSLNQSEFNALLDKLLPLGKELFSKEIEKENKRLEDVLKEKKDIEYELEIEKAKNQCWKEFANILFAQYQRLGADYDNFQKRIPKQTADAIGYEKEKIIRSLLPVLDNFESALGRLQNAQPAENAESVVKGIKITYDQMLDILRSHGVEQIKAVGEKFEPALHEAITQRDEAGKEEGVVLEEFAKGYKLNGRAIRPSKVIVNKLTTELPVEQQGAEPAKQSTEEPETTD